MRQQQGGEGSPPAHFALIDGLRGVAALVILLFHYKHFGEAGVNRYACATCEGFEPARAWLWPLYDYGYLAVQLFWVISGFVFASAYFGREVSGREFWVNRFARLYPLHLLTLLVVTVLQFAALAKLQTNLLYDGFDWPNFLLQLGFASNWIDASRHTFNGPIWSVSVEVLVYALFWVGRRRLEVLGAAGFGAVLLACIGLVGLLPGSQVPACAFFFIAGVASARLHAQLRAGRGRPRLLIALWLVAVAAASVAPGIALRSVAAVAGLGGMLVVLAMIEPWVSARIRSGALWIGDCTYGLYLWHVPVQLALLLAFLPGEGMVAIARQGWFMAGWLAAMVVLARTSFVWIELPARQYMRRRFGAPSPVSDGKAAAVLA